MKRRMNLSEAASLTGLTVSGIRARAKKSGSVDHLAPNLSTSKRLRRVTVMFSLRPVQVSGGAANSA